MIIMGLPRRKTPTQTINIPWNNLNMYWLVNAEWCLSVFIAAIINDVFLACHTDFITDQGVQAFPLWVVVFRKAADWKVMIKSSK